MTCKELSNELLKTPDLEVVVDAHKGFDEHISYVRIDKMWNTSSEKKDYAIIVTNISH